MCGEEKGYVHSHKGICSCTLSYTVSQDELACESMRKPEGKRVALARLVFC
jgi:hypothetical protein